MNHFVPKKIKVNLTNCRTKLLPNTLLKAGLKALAVVNDTLLIIVD